MDNAHICQLHYKIARVQVHHERPNFYKSIYAVLKILDKGGFLVMAEITRILTANFRRQFFFVITTAASTRCLVQNFQLICYSQRVNATSQYNDSGSSTCSYVDHHAPIKKMNKKDLNYILNPG